jgi:hypothetical protein
MLNFLQFRFVKPAIAEATFMRSGSWILISLIGFCLLTAWLVSHRTGRR